MTEKKGYALVTGVTSGIGRAFAWILARDGWNLVVVARNRERLQALKKDIEKEGKVRCLVIVQDLADPLASMHISEYVKEKGLEIDVLINNAGFGYIGAFSDMTLEELRAQMQCNMLAVAELTWHFLGSMKSRGRGWILNVASTAGFQPGPWMTVYYATKAFVLSLSEALAEEVRSTGVVVSCLCPGPVVTEFQERAKMTSSRIGKRSPFFMSPERVAQDGYRHLMRGKDLIIPGFSNRVGIFFLRLTPRWLVRKVTAWLNKPKNMVPDSTE